MFFVRISDWERPEAPARIPIIPADLPRQDHPLPKALDDPSAAKLLRAAQAEPRMLVRVVVEVLLRTGLRVGEFTALQADAIVLIGAAHWLHVPVGKLREDRYLPLHPHLITLIDDYRTTYVAADNALLLPGRTTAPDRLPLGSSSLPLSGRGYPPFANARPFPDGKLIEDPCGEVHEPGPPYR